MTLVTSTDRQTDTVMIVTYLRVALELPIESRGALGPDHVHHLVFEAEEGIAEFLGVHTSEGSHFAHRHGGVQLQVRPHHANLHLLLNLIQKHLYTCNGLPINPLTPRRGVKGFTKISILF